MKLTNSYSFELFIKICIGCNLCFSKFTPLEDEIYPQRYIYPRLRTTAPDGSISLKFPLKTFVSDVISEVVFGPFWLMLPGLGLNR